MSLSLRLFLFLTEFASTSLSFSSFISFPSFHLFRRCFPRLFPWLMLVIVILFYLLALFYILFTSSMLSLFLFFRPTRHFSIPLFPFLFIFSLFLFYLFSRFESSFSVFLHFSLPSFLFSVILFTSFVLPSPVYRAISISLFVDQVDSVTIPRRPPRRDHSFATVLPVMNGIPSSLSRLYTVYRLRTMGHNYINDNRVTNFTEYRKLVNF